MSPSPYTTELGPGHAPSPSRARSDPGLGRVQTTASPPAWLNLGWAPFSLCGSLGVRPCPFLPEGLYRARLPKTPASLGFGLGPAATSAPRTDTALSVWPAKEKGWAPVFYSIRIQFPVWGLYLYTPDCQELLGILNVLSGLIKLIPVLWIR